MCSEGDVKRPSDLLETDTMQGQAYLRDVGLLSLPLQQ